MKSVTRATIALVRAVILIPELLGHANDDSPLRQRLPSLAALAELGELKRLASLPQVETPEALWLGMAPGDGQLRQGPLTVAALGADPPPRSTHFHLSLLGLVDEVVLRPPPVVPPEELRVIADAARKLNTNSLTMVVGENLDHGLVWEDLGDFATTAAHEVVGKKYQSALPEGDAESALRRFIDDSINLLTDLELNHRRIDEELTPLNLLWPWGHGVRKAVPNLALRRGEPAVVESASLRMSGLARLAGYKHQDRATFGRGINTRLEAIAQRCLERPLSFVVIDAPAELRDAGKAEELHWFVRQLDERLLKPLLEEVLKREGRLAVLAPATGGGLGVSFQSRISHANSHPFDERALDERSLPQVDTWTAVEQAAEPLPSEALRSMEDPNQQLR